jgi:inorganic pyrophosphatase
MMVDLTCLPLHLDTDTRICRAIIETPRGSRIKVRYDPQARSFMLGRVLPEGMMFPFDFGFLPSTLGEDGGIHSISWSCLRRRDGVPR